MADLSGFRRSAAMRGRVSAGSPDQLIPSSRAGTVRWKNFCFQDRKSTYLNLNAYPTGYYPGGAVYWPQKAGQISSFRSSMYDAMTLSSTASISEGRNIAGTTTMSLTVSATGLLAALGAGSFTMSLTATGSILSALLGAGSFSMSLSATGAIKGAGIMAGTTTMTLTVAAEAYAIGYLAGDWTADYGTFTPAILASAVWDALTADHAIPATMGAAMAAAGSAGDPWSTNLPGSYVSGQAGYIIGNKLDVNVSTRSVLTGSDVATVVWSEEMDGTRTAKQTQRLILSVLAGNTSGFPDNPKFRDIDDTKDVVTAVIDENKNRTVTLDLD